MKIDSKGALELLEEIRKNLDDDRWIGHSICVGDTGYRIAEALKEKGVKVDPEKVRTLGYIHDVGKYTGESKGHIMRGYEYLKSKGYDEEYCNICLIHSYLNNDITCTAGVAPKPEDNPFLADFLKNHNYSIEEKIINLCDLMCPKKDTVYTMDKRLIDVMMRKGVCDKTQYHLKEAYKLKQYFDDLLGYNLYDLFPEIKENL